MSERAWAPPRAVVTRDWLDADLLDDRVATVSKEERTLFDELTGGPSADLLLFGAGNLGRHTLAGLRRVGREPLAFVDNDGSLHGTLVDGLPVLSPQEAGHRYGNTVVVVVTVWSPNQRLAYPNIAAQMSALGCSRTVTFVPLFWKYQEEFLPYFCLDAPHRLYAAAPAVKATLNLFADDRSCMEFLTQLSYLISSMDGVDLSATSEREWYFPRDLVELSDQEVFIDCGAYDGDTLESFLGATAYRFSAAVAFEPDSHAAARLRAVVQELPSGVRDRIQIEEKAVGGTPGMVRFEGGGTPGSRIVETGSVMVDCVTLDTAVLELAPTFIKMDIEGAEEAALLGAAETIRVHRPVLAICIYHLQADLYRLPTLMRRLCSNYALFLRRQARDSDLVCFAIPNERRRR